MKHLFVASIVAFVLCLGMSMPAFAEAVNGYDGLGRALTQLFVYVLAYLVFVITLIVLALRRKWAGFKTLALAGVTLIILYPLVDIGVIQYQKSRVAQAEIRKPTPDLVGKSILFISLWDKCYNSVCQAMLDLREGAPLWTLTTEQVEAMDFTAPIDLASLDYYQWVPDPELDNTLILQPAPKESSPVFDYLIVSRAVYYKNRASPIMTALSQRPVGTLLGNHLSITDLAAPIEGNQLEVAALEPDLLSLYISRKARRAPLMIENTISGSDRSWRWRAERAAWYCGEGNERTEAQFRCTDRIK